MYIVMKDGKYFTGIIIPDELERSDRQTDDGSSDEYLDFIAWSHHPSAAKVWEKHRSWADKAASKWGGKVIEIRDRIH